ncbi:MAG: ABC transporter substrate-binding protein [Thermomicrobiales bacterium]
MILGDGSYLPVLAAEILSRANNGLAADGTMKTWKLKAGVKWSDGQPFTAKDVVFTYNYIIDKETGATTTGSYQTIKTVEAVDDTTVKITFNSPQAAWFIPFVNGQGHILPSTSSRMARARRRRTSRRI